MPDFYAGLTLTASATDSNLHSVTLRTFFQGDPGTPGDPGTNGNTIHNGDGAPDSGLGVDGDFYIDTVGVSAYGPKTSGAWGSATSLVGSDGSDGSDGAIPTDAPLNGKQYARKDAGWYEVSASGGVSRDPFPIEIVDTATSPHGRPVFELSDASRLVSGQAYPANTSRFGILCPQASDQVLAKVEFYLTATSGAGNLKFCVYEWNTIGKVFNKHHETGPVAVDGSSAPLLIATNDLTLDPAKYYIASIISDVDLTITTYIYTSCKPIAWQTTGLKPYPFTMLRGSFTYVDGFPSILTPSADLVLENDNLPALLYNV